MGVLINKKRCDNADVCPCIEGCPSKAFYYDKEKKTVAVHNELCINCRKCMITCEAGAVKVYRNEEEYAKLKTEYDKDIMTIEELFQDRYGASSIEEKYRLQLEDLDQLIKDANVPLLIEFYDEDRATCLINSIPIEEIMGKIDMPVSYRKIEVKDASLLTSYEIDDLPALLIIEKGHTIFRHIGPVDYKEKTSFFDELANINH